MTKLRAFLAALAAALGIAGCATPDPYAAKQTETAPQTQTPAKASVTFRSTFCEARIRASDTADMAKLKIARLTSPEAEAPPKTNLPSGKECFTVIFGVPGAAKTKTEFSYAAVDLPNCNQGSAAVPNLVAQGIGAFANVAGQAAGNGALAQTGKRAAQEAVKNAQQPARTPANGISAACKADLSEAYDLASKAIAEMKTAYAKEQGVPSTTVQVMLVPTFAPKYWGPAAPSKK